LRCKIPCNLSLFPFCGSQEIIRGSRKFVVWSPAPPRYCASSRSCSAQWRGRWWLSKIFDYHVLHDAPSQSSSWKLSAAMIRCKRIYNFWCSMLVLHQLLYVLSIFCGTFMIYLD
jgi:hypothetical protein